MSKILRICSPDGFQDPASTLEWFYGEFWYYLGSVSFKFDGVEAVFIGKW